ncbi:MAG: neutral zinc metallopeptidase [bacterium]|nr:neutral zinc metallopeptidase [bacterium]
MAEWNKLGSRGNVEDRRGMGPIAGGGLGLGGIALLLLFNYIGGGSFTDVLPEVLNQIQTSQVVQQENFDTSQFEGQDNYEVFTATVLGSTNDMWASLFAQNNLTYTPPKLVLFRGSTQSTCGGASAQIGPHYCPLDKTIYLDETFFEELQSRFGGSIGDVAQAYVIAHEVGHHAQLELGIMEQVNAAGSENEEIRNSLSIKQELQADCFAGLWAYSIKDKGVFMPGEISEAIDAASAVGDDNIQKNTTGRINPESWTHGSSAERVGWFNRGFETGSFASCDTFNN